MESVPPAADAPQNGSAKFSSAVVAPLPSGALAAGGNSSTGGGGGGGGGAAPPAATPGAPLSVTTKSGLVLRFDAPGGTRATPGQPIAIGTPPSTPSLPPLGLGGTALGAQGGGGAPRMPGRVPSSGALAHVHSSPVFRLMGVGGGGGGGDGEGSESKGSSGKWGLGGGGGGGGMGGGSSSPSLPPLGLPPQRIDTDEDLMHKAVQWEIDRDEIEWAGSVALGAGAYGEVVRARWRGTPVAVKKVTSLTGASAMATRELRHEIAVMSHMHHPRVVQFLGACTRAHPWLIVFEYLPGGALSTLLDKRLGRPLPHALAGRFALDAAQGLRYLHEHKPAEVVHRDLKPSNLVVDASGHLKITDFGLAKVVDMLKVARDDTYVMTGETGSYRYMSPEVFRHEKYTEKVDVYALGMLMFYMWHGEPPFAWMPPLEAVRCAAMEHLRPELRPGMDPDIGAIIKRCWHPDASQRPSARDVCQALEKHFPVEADTGVDPVAAAEGCKCAIA